MRPAVVANVSSSISNTATIFGILALLVVIVAALFSSFLLAFSALNHLPIPDVKSIIVKDLNTDSARIYVDLEFTPQFAGGLFSFKTEGKTQVGLYLPTKKDSDPQKPILSIDIPKDISFDLTAKKATRLVLDDILVKFHEIDPAIFLNLFDDNTLQFKPPAGLKIKVQTHAVLKSFWIPLGASISFPHTFEFNLDDKKKVSKSKKVEPVDQKTMEQKVKALLATIPKILKFKTDADGFSLAISQKIPLDSVPGMINVEVPELKLAANMLSDDKKTELPLLQIKMDSFAVARPSNTVEENQSIQIDILIQISSAAFKNIKKIIERIRDDRLHEINLVAGVDYQENSEKVGLMHWLRDAKLHFNLGNLESAVAASKAPAQASEPTSDSNKEPSVIDQVLKKILKAVTVRIEGMSMIGNNGARLMAKIGVSREYLVNELDFGSEFLIGSFPGFGVSLQQFDGRSGPRKELVNFEMKINPVEQSHRNLNIDFLFNIPDFSALMGPGEAPKEHDQMILAAVNNLKGIKGLSIVFSDRNFFSSLLTPLNADFDVSSQSIYLPGTTSEFPIVARKKAELAALSSSPKPEPVHEVSEVLSTPNINLRNYLIVKNEQDTQISMRIEAIPRHDIVKTLKLSWGRLNLALHRDERKLLEFVVSSGNFVIGLDGALTTVGGALQAIIKSPDESLNSFEDLLKSFLKPSKDSGHFTLTFNFGKSHEQASIQISVNALKTFLDSRKSEPVAVEGIPKQEVVVTKPDFIGNLKNSVLQLISFQAPTLFFHINVPDGNYCDETVPSFRMALTIDLPVLEASLCARETSADNPSKCFIRAGSSRPMILESEMHNGRVCFMRTKIMPDDGSLVGHNAVKSVTPYKFEPQEFPIHVSISDLTNLIRFGNVAGAKLPQFITLGSWPEAHGLTKLIGRLGAIALNILLNDKNNEAKPTDSHLESAPASVVNQLHILDAAHDPASIEVVASSPSSHVIDLFMTMGIPKSALEGIKTAMDRSNWFQWFVVRWGLIEYELSIPDVFDATIYLNPGEVDIKDEGVVLQAGQDKFGLRVKFEVHNEKPIGSTAIRQIIGAIKKYTSVPLEERTQKFDSSFFAYLNEHSLMYKFKTQGTHGPNDSQFFVAEGTFPIINVFKLLDSIARTPKIVIDEKSSINVDSESVSSSETPQESSFSDLRVKLSVVRKADYTTSRIHLPCMIPSMCAVSHLKNSEKPFGDGEFQVQFQNLLVPLTKMVSNIAAGVFSSLKMSNYPSHFRFAVALMNDATLTPILNGASIASLNLEPFHFERVVPIAYSGQAAPVPIQAVSDDIFALRLGFRIPRAVTGLMDFFSIVPEYYMASIIPPIYFEEDQGKYVPKSLVYNPLHLSFSNDGLENTNLLSSILNSVVPELINFGINPPDELAAPIISAIIEIQKGIGTRVYEAIQGAVAGLTRAFGGALGYFNSAIWGKEKETAPEAPLSEPPVPLPVVKPPSPDGSILQFSYNTIPSEFSILSIAKFFASCAIGSCSSLDLGLELKLPFQVPVLEFELAAPITVQFYCEDLPIFQMKFENEKPGNENILFSRKGAELHSFVSINFNGVEGERSVTGKPSACSFSQYVPKHVKSSLSDENNPLTNPPTQPTSPKKTPMKLKVSFGDDLELGVDISLPLYHLRALYRWADSSTKAVKKPEIVETLNLPKLAIEKFPGTEKLLPQRVSCFSTNLDEKINLERLASLDLEKTAVLYPENEIQLLPNVDGHVFLQLRTNLEHPVCGYPTKLNGLKLVLRRETKKWPFVNLISVFDSKVPKENQEYEFETKFDPNVSLFKVNLKLPFAGNYRVFLKLPDGSEVKLEYTSIYVSNEH